MFSPRACWRFHVQMLLNWSCWGVTPTVVVFCQVVRFRWIPFNKTTNFWQTKWVCRRTGYHWDMCSRELRIYSRVISRVGTPHLRCDFGDVPLLVTGGWPMAMGPTSDITRFQKLYSQNSSAEVVQAHVYMFGLWTPECQCCRFKNCFNILLLILLNSA